MKQLIDKVFRFIQQTLSYKFWVQKGNALTKLERYEEAITSYDTTLTINPDNYEAWGNRGLTLYNLGKYEEAIVSYNKAIEINPDYY